MTSSIAQLQTLIAEYQNFKNAYNTAGAALNNVITIGTVLFGDPNLAAEFPNSITAYKAYLVSLQTSINTFIGALPVEPPLNG